MHRIGTINFDDLQSEKRYSKWRAYGQSKLANLLFANELGKRAAAADVELTSVAAHPGYAATNLQAAGPKMSGNRFSERLIALGNKLFAQSDADGALPLIYAATSDDLTSGQYVGPDGPLGQRGKGAKPVGRSKKATNQQTASRLWEVSEKLTGVTFGPLDPKA